MLAVRIAAAMRLLITFFLSLCLTFNAAYAVGGDVCDALEKVPSEGVNAVLSEHGKHFGHHIHDHDHVQASSDKSAPADPTAQSAHADHCHPHQCFTSVIPGEVALSSLSGRQLLPSGPDDQFVSLPAARLERPPRAALT